MTFKEKWRGLSRFRQVLLIILAVITVGSGAALVVISSWQGIAYQDSLLRYREENGVRRYTGRVDWQPAEFTVYPDKTLEYRWGEYHYGPYQIIEDPSASPKGGAAGWDMLGIEIWQGDEMLFRGGYKEAGTWFILYQENGEPLEMMGITVSNGAAVYDEHGNRLTEADLHTPSLSAVAKLVLQPELTHQGSASLYLLAILIALIAAVEICFPEVMFRMSLWGRVRDPWEAEPSDFYLLMTQLGWIVLTGLDIWICCVALTTIN